MDAPPDDLREALLKAPSDTVDYFVDAISPQFVETICAFANSKGGDIYLGVERGPAARVDMELSGLKNRGSDEVHVLGVNPESVIGETSSLETHFDDPLPNITVETLEEKGPDGMLVRIHVEPQHGKDPIALNDLTIWHREGTENKQIGVRQRPIRSAAPDVEPKRKKQPAAKKKKSSKKSGKKKAGKSTTLTHLVLVEDLRSSFNPTSTVLGSIDAAQKLAFEAEPVNASHIFYGMIEYGRSNLSTPQITAFLARQIQGKHKRQFLDSSKRYLSAGPERAKYYEDASSQMATPTVRAIFDYADSIRTQVAGYEAEHWLSGRHLLAALLLEAAVKDAGDDGVGRQIIAAGLKLDQLRADFLQLLVTEGHDNERAEWQRLLGPERQISPHQIAHYNADRARGADQLNITPDVNAMANLIASTALEPPLSVGLFGNWGSGKSFFIDKLEERIDWLAERTREQPGVYEKSYWKNVVQIKFNAWNYVDANLWASLVSHIFDALKRSDKLEDRPFVAARKKALDQLSVASEAKADAETKVKQAKKARDEAQERKRTREIEIKAAQDSLGNVIVQNVWDQVRNNVIPANEDLEKHLKNMGLAKQDLQQSAEQVYRHLQEVTTLAGRLRAVWLTMLRRDGAGSLFWVCGVLAVVVLIASVVCMSWKPNIAWLTGLVGEAAVLLGGIAKWAQKASDKVSQIMEPARKLHTKIESALQEAEMQKAKDIAVWEEKLKQRQADYDAATRELDESQQAVDAAEAELEEVETGLLIRRFIEQRVGSEDYRRHLGLVATIQNDFHHLSQLIEDFNDSLIEGDGKTPAKPVENLGINRVVLYVDDLDRCPPKRVVEVLQAIHLLLAFPLFVVVVAVDSRWVSYALEDQYPHLLVESPAPLPTENGGTPVSQQNGNLVSSAGPRDYLEKIFQVPFWIRPMDPKGCERLIDQLVKRDQMTQPEQSLPSDSTKPEPQPGKARSGDGEPKPPVPPQPDGKERSKPPTPPGGDGGATPPEAPSKPGGAATPPPARPESLRLEPWEVSAMKSLAPIIGRSPRETKRFVNVYRLMKAAIDPGEFDEFVGTQKQSGTFPRAMVLLALATGCPHVSTSLFRRATDSESQDSNLGAVIAALENQIPLSVSSEWDKVNDFFTDDTNGNWSKVKMDDLRNWIGRVSQFSFEPPAPTSSQSDSSAHIGKVVNG